jgi:hypothetical protein
MTTLDASYDKNALQTSVILRALILPDIIFMIMQPL